MRASPEFSLHKAIIQHLMFRAKPNVLYWHTPNGNKLAPRTAAHNKQMGVRAGVADLTFIINGRAYFLELKAEKGRQTDPQRHFEHDAVQAGALYAIAHNMPSALHILETWGVLKPDASAKPLRKAA